MAELLPLPHRQQIAEFRAVLEQANQQLMQPERTGAALRETIAPLQPHFREQVLSLPLDELTETAGQQMQSVQVEMDKQLRLLVLDGQFLHAARQPETLEHRRRQVCDRVALLIRYCDILLEPHNQTAEEAEPG